MSTIVVMLYDDVIPVTAPTIRSSSFVAGTSRSNQVLNKPSGTAVGDVLVMFIAGVCGIIPPTPSGFTRIAYAAAGAHAIEGAAYFRVVDGTEPGSWTLTAGNSNPNIGSNGAVHAVCYAISGSDLSTPVVALSVGTKSTSPVVPSVTTTQDNALVIACISQAQGDSSMGAITESGGWTEDQDHAAGRAGAWAQLETAHQVFAAAGATGTSTFTATFGANTHMDGRHWFAVAVNGV